MIVLIFGVAVVVITFLIALVVAIGGGTQAGESIREAALNNVNRRKRKYYNLQFTKIQYTIKSFFSYYKMDEQQKLLIKLAHTKMPFGKYKNVDLINLPEPYVVWFKNKGFPQGQLGEQLKLVGGNVPQCVIIRFDLIQPQ